MRGPGYLHFGRLKSEEANLNFAEYRGTLYVNWPCRNFPCSSLPQNRCSQPYFFFNIPLAPSSLVLLCMIRQATQQHGGFWMHISAVCGPWSLMLQLPLLQIANQSFMIMVFNASPCAMRIMHLALTPNRRIEITQPSSHRERDPPRACSYGQARRVRQ